jgi:hypothetical protein
MGRPHLLTPTVQDAIVKSVRAGNYLEPSAIAAGVGYSTAKKWMQQGAGTHPTVAPTDKTVAFYEAVSKAEAEQEIETVEVLSHNDDWRARSRMLEGRHPERWAPKVDGSANDPASAVLTTLTALLALRTPKQPAALIEATMVEVEETE